MTAEFGHAHGEAIDRELPFEAEIIPINLRRTQLVGLVAFGDLIVQAGIGVVRGHAMLVAMAAFGAALMLVFAATAYAAARMPAHIAIKRAIPLGLMISLLLLAQMLAILGAPLHDQANGYCIVLIGVAALFKVTPRHFLAIAGSTYAIMLLWIAHLGMPIGMTLQNAGTASFALGAAVMIRNLLYHARRRDHRLRMIIADQNRALSNANHELAQRNHDVRETMAIAAHDLRSPMAGLHSLLKLAADRPSLSPDMLRPMLVEARQSAGSMLDLLGKLLQAHEANHRGPIALEPHELLVLARAAIERIRIAATSRNIEIDLIGDEQPIPVRTDEDAIARILDNLLSNAVRYSHSGGVIYVMCRRNESSATIEVVDQGIGIPPADETRIFDKFQRGSKLPVAGGMGAGLGLYIAREAARSIAAELDYHRRIDGGSIFRLIVPLQRQGEPLDRPIS